MAMDICKDAVLCERKQTTKHFPKDIFDLLSYPGSILDLQGEYQLKKFIHNKEWSMKVLRSWAAKVNHTKLKNGGTQKFWIHIVLLFYLSNHSI